MDAGRLNTIALLDTKPKSRSDGGTVHVGQIGSRIPSLRQSRPSWIC